jgi:hypothetical protein
MNTNAGAPSISTTLPSTHVGDLLTVEVTGWPVPASLTITDSLGDTFSRAGSMQTNSKNIFASLYYAISKGGSATITVKPTSSQQLSMVAAEFSGINQDNPLDASTGNIGSSDTPSSGTMTPSQAGDLLIGGGSHDANTTTSAGTGMTMIGIATEDSDSHQPADMDYRVSANMSPIAGTFSLAGSALWVQNAALFRAAPALSATASIVHTLAKTWSGTEVSVLQQRLSALGFFNSNYITGYFGNLTELAVKAFQTANNFAAVGVVGPLTRAALNVGR